MTARVLVLNEYRRPTYVADPQPPAAGAGMPDRRAPLAVCWHRSQLRADLISRGAGLLIGSVALALVLWVLSVLGVLPA